VYQGAEVVAGLHESPLFFLSFALWCCLLCLSRSDKLKYWAQEVRKNRRSTHNTSAVSSIPERKAWGVAGFSNIKMLQYILFFIHEFLSWNIGHSWPSFFVHCQPTWSFKDLQRLSTICNPMGERVIPLSRFLMSWT